MHAHNEGKLEMFKKSYKLAIMNEITTRELTYLGQYLFWIEDWILFDLFEH